MANKLYEESDVQAIANAIRTKNGLSSVYKIADMPAAILAIEGGDDGDNIYYPGEFPYDPTMIDGDHIRY